MEDSLVAGAILGLSVAAPFGPVSLACVQQSLNHGYRNGLVAGCGAATAHGIFATTGVVGAGTAFALVAPWADAIHLVSALVLIGLGIRTMLRTRRAAAPVRMVSVRAAYASSLMLALSNPMTVIPYLALATVAAGDASAGTGLSAWSIPGVILAAGCWYACLSLAAACLRRGIAGSSATWLLNLIAGGALVGFGVMIGCRLLC